ncbi:EF-hand domain-containing protein [Winogradskyella sp.]|uniref:EF-hand domain-containing protein n=1 Tax=Winogradskyella sp. TaxID=1883156 RepID=UPI00260C3842|nr:EF-hand domain-containing protein [Winogradskyella sp.]
MESKTLKLGLITGALSLVFMLNGNAQQERPDRERREPPTFAELLKHMDENEDGKLSKKEVKGPLKEHFDKVDLNEDGFITEEEFKKAPKPKRRNRDN